MRLKFIFGLVLVLSGADSFSQYAPVGDKIRTEWSETINPDNVWDVYPRPLLKRSEWKNLNGIWQYAIVGINQQAPEKYDGDILVPFPVESSLSGVGKTVGNDNNLWYRRSFSVPSAWKNKNVMLNFGAVDWKCDVWVNGIKIGSHTGGYTPFSLDITNALNKNNDNELVVRVFDPTDRGYQPRGKQVNRPGGIWYTPVTGIWQTVWIEPVNPVNIKSIKTTPDIDCNTVTVDITPSSEMHSDLLSRVEIFEDGKIIAEGKAINNQPVEIKMPDNVKLWSPDSPHLYDMTISLYKDGKLIDKVNSYTAMRKFSTKRDDNGYMRIQLNNNDLFQFGPLDQGWWPDGLYTAPSNEASIYDINKTKELGYNMIRKHVKVEPATWYAHCDKVGMIVWQDMPNGDKSPKWQNHEYFSGDELSRSKESETNYKKEWKEIIDYLYNNPCISTWVPFNEAWGQFKTEEITDWTKEYDPTRLVNPASGGNFYHCGDMLDLHNYPAPDMYLSDPDRVNVLGEYGGIGLAMDGHLWAPDRNWGYIQFKNEKEVTDEYIKYAKMLLDLIQKGFSAAVYTQTTDVEIEVNGIMTYDRKKMKVQTDRIREANQAIVHSLDK